MLKAFRLILNNRSIGTTTLVLFIYAFTIAATTPFQAVIAINELGLSNQAFALVLGAGSVVNVVTSVSVGLISDHSNRRKLLFIALCFSGFAGYGLTFALHNAAAFIICSLTLIPPSMAIYSMIFANVRRESVKLESQLANTVTSIVRSVYSAGWVLVPGLMGWWLSASPSLMPIYLVAALASLACAIIYGVFAPAETMESTNAKLGFAASLAVLFNKGIVLRLASMTLLLSALLLSFTSTPLVIVNLIDGNKSDVGKIYSLIPIFEVPFMLMWGWVANRISIEKSLAIAALIFAAYMLALSQVTHVWQVYALTIVNACAASAILSLQISYFQNLIVDRPGLSTALLPINSFISTALRAAVFAGATMFTSYQGTMVVGSCMFVVGAALMVWLAKLGERKTDRRN